jgi:hypothetical protein
MLISGLLGVATGVSLFLLTPKNTPPVRVGLGQLVLFGGSKNPEHASFVCPVGSLRNKVQTLLVCTLFTYGLQ